MDFLLQFGYGMMEHSRHLIQEWNGGGVVLSPRDLDPQQLVNLASDIAQLNGFCYIDPQCYHRGSNHPRLKKYQYFNNYCGCDTRSIVDNSGIRPMIDSLIDLNQLANCQNIILPGLLCEGPGGLWGAFQDNVVNYAQNLGTSHQLYATIALSSGILRDEQAVESVLELATTWPVDGYYVVAVSPSGYLHDNPVWLSNLLAFVGGLKLTKRKVIVGYCNHQLLCLGLTKADAIASGTWMNVRSFGVGRYIIGEEEETKRKATWYYCPKSLSEYKLPFLDIARSAGMLPEMKPEPSYGSSYADLLFTGPDPSTVSWGEPLAFRHYLTCIRHQSQLATQIDYQTTYDFHQSMLNDAEKVARRFHGFGVLGQTRDFLDFFDVNRAAMITFNRSRGPQFRRHWRSL